ncbi:ACT domain-containing protein [Pseudomonas sp. Marseille-Q8238]
MAGETSLAVLLRNLSPRLNPGDYAFCCLSDGARLGNAEVIASIREPEGLSVVLPRHEADRLGLAYDYVAAWITLTVHSALSAVGLTAAFANALANQGISCNVVAGFHHDHLFVAREDAAHAMATLQQLARDNDA